MLRLITVVVKIVHELFVRVTGLVVLPQLFDDITLVVPVNMFCELFELCIIIYLDIVLYRECRMTFYLNLSYHILW